MYIETLCRCEADGEPGGGIPHTAEKHDTCVFCQPGDTGERECRCYTGGATTEGEYTIMQAPL